MTNVFLQRLDPLSAHGEDLALVELMSALTEIEKVAAKAEATRAIGKLRHGDASGVNDLARRAFEAEKVAGASVVLDVDTKATLAEMVSTLTAVGTRMRRLAHQLRSIGPDDKATLGRIVDDLHALSDLMVRE